MFLLSGADERPWGWAIIWRLGVQEKKYVVKWRVCSTS